MPLPQTRVFHPEWSGHHRPTATATMSGECVITRAATTGPGPTTHADGTWTPGDRVTVYSGPCRVTAPPFSREQRLSAGEEQLTRRRYAVMVRWDAAEFQIGDQIQITGAADPKLVGKAFRLVDILHGSEQWQRNLIGEEIEGRT